MKPILLAAALFMAADCIAADGPHLALAEKLLVLSGVEKQLQTRLSEAKPVLKEHNDKTAALWKELHVQLVAVYADTYTPEELPALVAFFESPAGQAFAAKQPEIWLKTSKAASDKLLKFMGVD